MTSLVYYQMDDDDDDSIIEQERSQKAAQFGWFNDLYMFDTGKTLNVCLP